MTKTLKNETFSYLFFGVLTTIVNYSIFVVGLSVMGEDAVLTVNIIAFIGATLFVQCASGGGRSCVLQRSPGVAYRSIPNRLFFVLITTV